MLSSKLSEMLSSNSRVFAEVNGRLEAQQRKTETVAANKAQRLDNKRVADEEKKAKETQKNKKRKEKEAADVSFASATVRKPGSNRVDHAKTAKELAKENGVLKLAMQEQALQIVKLPEQLQLAVSTPAAAAAPE